MLDVYLYVCSFTSPQQTLKQKEEQMRAGSSRQGVIILRWRGDYLVGNGNYLPIDPRQDRRQNRSEGLEGCIVGCMRQQRV